MESGRAHLADSFVSAAAPPNVYDHPQVIARLLCVQDEDPQLGASRCLMPDLNA